MGIARDVQRGVGFVERSAKINHPLGLAVLSAIQSKLSGFRVHPDVSEETLRKSVALGLLRDGEAGGPVWWTTEAYLLNGDGKLCDRNPERAIKLLEKSLASGYLDAWCSYGWCLIEGAGIPRDRVDGFSWVMKAAERGYGPAMVLVAELYAAWIGFIGRLKLARTVPSTRSVTLFEKDFSVGGTS